MKANGSDGLYLPNHFDAAPTAAIAAGEHIRRFDQIPDVMTMEIPAIEYLVDGMISRKTITLWTGSDGTAKTFLAQKMRSPSRPGPLLGAALSTRARALSRL